MDPIGSGLYVREENKSRGGRTTKRTMHPSTTNQTMDLSTINQTMDLGTINQTMLTRQMNVSEMLTKPTG